MTDTAPESLLDWMTGLVADPAARARFVADPQHEIGSQGLAGLDPADVAQAMPLMADTVAARLDTTVELPSAPALLAGESPLDALVRHFSSVPAAVGPPEHDLDDWTESLVDDLAGAPDGLEGVVGNAPGVDLDLDGTGDLDGAHHDHDLDVMTRLDDHHALDGSAPAADAATPTLAFLPGSGAPPAPAPVAEPDDEPAPAGTEHADTAAGTPVDLHVEDVPAEPEPDHHDVHDLHDVHEHALDHDLDVAP